jgi:hypothetical protein
MQIVNGYACLTCSDVAKAKRGIDPSANPLQAAQGDKPGQNKGTAQGAKDASGVNQPLASGARGTQVNVLL